MSRILSSLTGLAGFVLVQSVSVAAPGTATDTITISEDMEIFTQLILEGNGAASNWAIISNGFSEGGFGSFGEFLIGYNNGSASPLLIMPGTYGHFALSIDGNSRVELGQAEFTLPIPTGTPLTLTDSLTGNNEPNIHFNTTQGYWEIWAASGGMGISDFINGNGENPFVIQEGAPTNAFVLDTNGFIGMGTLSPTTRLHVTGSDGATQLLVAETGTLGARNLFKIENNGPTRFQFENTDSGEKWTFNAAVGELRFAHSGTGATAGTEFSVFANGNARLAGLLTENSDVNTKQDIEAVDHQIVLAKVMELPIAEWSYKDAPDSRHIGPMAQDFYKSFGLGDTDRGITSIDTGGVALAAIQSVKQEKDSEIEVLKAELQRMDERMMQLEMALAEVLRNQSSEAQVGSAN